MSTILYMLINQRDPNKNIKKVHRSNFVDTV